MFNTIDNTIITKKKKTYKNPEQSAFKIEKKTACKMNMSLTSLAARCRNNTLD